MAVPGGSIKGDARRATRIACRAIASVLFALLGLSGCGGTGAGPVAVRVGHTSISMRTVEHWTSVITRGAVVADVSDPAGQSPRQQALSLLIASAWLEGEASRQGLRPSRRQLARIVEAQKASAPDGAAGFATALSETGETLADVDSEARASWAASALARRLEATTTELARAQVPSAVVARFYHAHIARYHLRERRYYDLHEAIPTKAAALALARQLGAGTRFGEKASKERPYRPRNFNGLPGQAIAYRAVFAAKKLGVVVGPLPLQGQWCLFVMRRIAPARLQPFSEVRASIERRLLAIARQRARTQLLAAYRNHWIAATDCRPGYVVQRCRQYRGARAPEPAPFAGF